MIKAAIAKKFGLYQNFIFLILALFLAVAITPIPAIAATDPRTAPYNKVGVGVLSPEADIEKAAAMVNAKSDWGWVVVVIKKSERDVDRWQGVLNKLAKNHLIPIIRISGDFDSQGYWQKPKEEDAKSWADFLSKLYFPTKNKYIQVYNEVNHAGEWDGSVDPEGYANELNKTIGELKAKSDDFFILNAPLDLAVADGRDSMDAGRYFNLMESAVPGIFARIDGWASHSYPNPNFSASPLKSGRLGIDGYRWELSQIREYTPRNLPVFITETGWKRSDSLTEDVIADYFDVAFGDVWSDSRVVAVCPFVFDYPDGLYNSFSFKTDGKVLGKNFFNYYFKIQDLAKIVGNPLRENLADGVKFDFPNFIDLEKPKTVFLTIKNAGNFIWDARQDLKVSLDADGVKLVDYHFDHDEIYPGQEAQVTLKLVSEKKGDIPININVLDRDQVLFEKDVSIKSETRLAHFIRVVKALFS